LAWNRNSNECKSNLRVNKGEDRHKLARAVFHGKQGELRQRYREGREDELGALGLVVNMIVLWNTLYTNAALEQLAREGHHHKSEGPKISRVK
jgi:TnpA family transposase